MLAKGFKQAILVLSIMVLTVSAAWAAPKDSVLVGRKGDANSSEYTKTLPGGLEVTYKGIWKHDEKLEVSYSIVATRDSRLSVEYRNSTLKDTNDVVTHWGLLPSYEGSGRFGTNRQTAAEKAKSEIGPGVYINDKEQKEYMEIVADQPYKVMIRYWVPEDYLLTPTFASVIISVNGLPTEFKDVSVAP
jgi:hypothetical protein